MLSAADHKRIADAIGTAESQSAGEISCVFAQQVSTYREVPLVWAALVAFLVPPAFVVLGLHRPALDAFFSSWTDDSAHAVALLVARALSGYALVQAGLFASVALVVAIPAIRFVLTPAALKRHRVRQVARHHFVAAGARLSDAQPHILIFASYKDRQVELVAHDAIHRAVGDGPWNAAVAAVTDGMKRGRPADGFVRAIEICGAALAEHFPSDGAPKNLLSNDILET